MAAIPAMPEPLRHALEAFVETASPEDMQAVAIVSEQLVEAITNLESAMLAEVIDEAVLAQAEESIAQYYTELLTVLGVAYDEETIRHFVARTIDAILAEHPEVQLHRDRGTHEDKADLSSTVRKLLLPNGWQVSFSRVASFMISASIAA